MQRSLLFPSASQLLSYAQNPPSSASAVARTAGMCHFKIITIKELAYCLPLISALGAAFLPSPLTPTNVYLLQVVLSLLRGQEHLQLLSCLLSSSVSHPDTDR